MKLKKFLFITLTMALLVSICTSVSAQRTPTPEQIQKMEEIKANTAEMRANLGADFVPKVDVSELENNAEAKSSTVSLDVVNPDKEDPNGVLKTTKATVKYAQRNIDFTAIRNNIKTNVQSKRQARSISNINNELKPTKSKDDIIENLKNQ